MKTYKPKTLFSGAVIGKNINDKYVAIPDHYKGGTIKVMYKGEFMAVNSWDSAESYRVFPDKFGRDKNYTLGYFKWQPTA